MPKRRPSLAARISCLTASLRVGFTKIVCRCLLRAAERCSHVVLSQCDKQNGEKQLASDSFSCT